MKNLEKNENPLNGIFKQIKGDNNNMKYTPIIKSVNNIKNFFLFIKNSENSEEAKCNIIEDLIKLIKAYRGISIYFSIYDNESIFIFLFNLYLEQKTGEKLQKTLIDLIQELILNIELNKKIFFCIFQKMALINKELGYEKKIILSENFTKCLNYLNSLLSLNIENRLKPNNYFICNGEGNFNINISSLNLFLSYTITFIINFKIWNLNNNINIISNILKINFDSGKNINIDFDYLNCNLIMKELKEKKIIKKLRTNEYNNLVIIITGSEKKINFYFLLNGENKLNPIKYPNDDINYENKIENLEFFNNFFGEVSSISMISQNKDYESSSILSLEFLNELKNFKEGLWKRKIFSNFLELLNKEKLKKKNKLKLIFSFFSKNNIYNNNTENIIENINNNLYLKYNGNIRCHNYECYQKKLFMVNLISNIIPIPELLLRYEILLNNINFKIFLEIIINILSHKKKNMQYFRECKFFQIFSLFLEKYPKKFFTEKILELFLEIGKSIFPSKYDKLNSNYFHHILLNEKILSKYSEPLQINFWNNLLKFTQSDKYKIANYININKLCLILRFYDRNRYTEICCKKHLDMIKPEFIGNNKIMEPEMPKKLSYLENILIGILCSKEPKNACALFKLLLLDLSPCLSLFIINIFIKTFQKNIKNVKWKDQLIMELINAKYEVIIINCFIHGLPEIKIEILKLMYEIYQRLVIINKINYFINFENMLKTCFLPQKMFFSEKNILIFHDALLFQYKQKLFDILYLWLFGLKLDEDITKINFEKILIKNTNIILLLFAFIRELNDIDYTIKFLDQIQKFISNIQNSYTIFSFKNIIFHFLLKILLINFN